MSGFRGFPPELFGFFEELAGDDSKSFWDAHRADWQAHVRDPMRALLAELADEFGPPLKVGPRGYPSDHPRAELLRWKGAAVVREYDRAAWMHTPEALERVPTVWRGAVPLAAWLDAHVGASAPPAG
jgi:uncharacterized protein (DUF2461 family)